MLDYDELVLQSAAPELLATGLRTGRSVEGSRTGVAAPQLCARVLRKAAETTDEKERRRLLTFCIIGGGPTGVDTRVPRRLVRLVLPHEYPEFPPSDVRAVLLEAATGLPVFKRLVEVHAVNSRLGCRGTHRHTRRVSWQARVVTGTAPRSLPCRSFGPQRAAFRGAAPSRRDRSDHDRLR
jgi:hypothetical protein